MEAKFLDVSTYIAVSRQHGLDSGPDSEIGDLQEFLRGAHGVMDEAQHVAFRESPAVERVISGAMGLMPEEIDSEFQSLGLSATDPDAYIKVAQTHGESSEPDHEAGDLQEFLRAAWSLLSPDQKLEFCKTETVRSAYEGATGEEIPGGGIARPR